MSSKLKPNSLKFVIIWLYILILPTLADVSSLNWIKYPGNPVLELGASGDWDGNYMAYPSIINKDNYEIFYSGTRIGPTRWYQTIGYASSHDGINWAKYLGNPVLTPGSDWDTYHVYASSVIKQDSIYKMWYAGYSGGSLTRFGYATSFDGKNWEKYLGNPVLTGGAGQWDGRYLTDPTVIFDEGIYKMWYLGGTLVDGKIKEAVGYAVSEDGMNWIKYDKNPVFNTSELDVRPYIIKDSGLFIMVYNCFSGMGESTGICYATSPDGINWTPSSRNPIVTPGPPGSWDAAKLVHPAIIRNGGTYKIYYVGFDASGRSRIGFAYAEINPCLEEPAQCLLESLNSYPYDFYNEYYSYDDDALSPDTAKSSQTEVDADDTWIIRPLRNSHAWYPQTISFGTQKAGFDFNDWYGWNVVVTEVPGEPERTLRKIYPELEFEFGSDVEKTSALKKDTKAQSLWDRFLESAELSYHTNGFYTKGPIENPTSTRAEVSTLFGSEINLPLEGASMGCNGNYKKYYELGVFGSDWPEQAACLGHFDTDTISASYPVGINRNFGLFSFDGNIIVDLDFTPSLDAGINSRLKAPYALAGAMKSQLDLSAAATMEGKLCTVDDCDEINQDVGTLEISDSGLILEGVAPLANFTGTEEFQSQFARLSDGKAVKYRNLRELSPVIRVEGSEISTNAEICLDISEFGVPCSPGNCEKCILKEKLIKTKPWSIYKGEAKIIVHSPVDIHVYDEFGNHLGKNSEGGVDLEIEGSSYEEENDEKTAGFTTSTGRFMVVLKGTGDGKYSAEATRPILIETLEGPVLQNIVYEAKNIPTWEGKTDFCSFDYPLMEYLINKKVSGGMEVNTAISEALSEAVKPRVSLALEPTIISLPSQEGANGETIELNAALMSTSGPVEGATIDFLVDGSPAGSDETDEDGIAEISYEIPGGISLGNYEIHASFAGDETYLSSKAFSLLEVYNAPPVVSLSVPAFASGTVTIEGNAEDTNLKGMRILIDGAEVSSEPIITAEASDDLTYEWDTSLYEDGAHTIELEAEDGLGEKANAIKIVFVDNNAPVVEITEPEEGNHYKCGAMLEYSISDAWLKSSEILIDGEPYQEGTEASGKGSHIFEIKAEDYLGHSTYKKTEFFVDEVCINKVFKAGNDYKTGSMVVFFVTFEGLSNQFSTGSSIYVLVNGNPYIEAPNQICDAEEGMTKCLYKFRADKAGMYSIDVKVNGEVVGKDIYEFSVEKKK